MFINLINATQIFLLVLQYFNCEHLVFSAIIIATAHANSKYSYHLWTFEFLKYSYQKRMEGVLFSELWAYAY